MNMLPIVLLAAFVAAPLHAQVCSGGSGGGTDATGNQCSTPDEFAASTTGPGIPPPARAAKMTGVQQAVVAVGPVVRAPKMAARPSTPAVVAESPTRIAKVATQRSAPAKSAKMESGPVSSCSGGPDGGMDATGVQCGEAIAGAGFPILAQESGH